jgi:hypothetical protein
MQSAIENIFPFIGLKSGFEASCFRKIAQVLNFGKMRELK